MENFLEQIIEYKKEQVQRQKLRRSEASLRADAEAHRDRRPFLKSLETVKEGEVHIIAEIKRASPSRGDIRLNLDPAGRAAAYARGGASALSVLTETQWFKGSLQDLQTARNAVTLPVLRKDFIFTSYQIYESALIPADAILLIVRILSENQLNDYLALCASLGLDALVEVHTLEETERVCSTAAKLIGINNRNLSSFNTDTRTAIGLAKHLRADQIPVAASGISSRKDIEKNMAAGIYRFLVGESLVRSDNPEKLIAGLKGGA